MHPKLSPSERSSVVWPATGLAAALAKPAILVCCWLSSSLQGAFAQAPVDFRRDVLPILSENCFTCHGPDAKTRKADLRLDVKESALRTKDPVIVPGKSGESELFERVSSTDPDEVMPPPKSGKKLTPAQIDVLKKWIDQGASWKALGLRADRPAGTAAGSATRAGPGTRSTASCWPGSRPKGLSPSPAGRADHA